MIGGRRTDEKSPDQRSEALMVVLCAGARCVEDRECKGGVSQQSGLCSGSRNYSLVDVWIVWVLAQAWLLSVRREKKEGGEGSDARTPGTRALGGAGAGVGCCHQPRPSKEDACALARETAT